MEKKFVELTLLGDQVIVEGLCINVDCVLIVSEQTSTVP